MEDKVNESVLSQWKALDVSRRTTEKLNPQLVPVTDLDIEL